MKITTRIALFIMYVVAIIICFAVLDNALSPDSFLKSESIVSQFMKNPAVFFTVLSAYFALVIYLQVQYKRKNIVG